MNTELSQMSDVTACTATCQKSSKCTTKNVALHLAQNSGIGQALISEVSWKKGLRNLIYPKSTGVLVLEVQSRQNKSRAPLRDRQEQMMLNYVWHWSYEKHVSV